MRLKFLLASVIFTTVLSSCTLFEVNDRQDAGLPDSSDISVTATDEASGTSDSTESPDLITGNTFTIGASGLLTAELNNDGTFLIYEDKDKIADDHVSGTYEVYRGDEAIKKVDSMTEYGLTADEQTAVIDNTVESRDDYYAVVFNVDDVVTDGKTRDTRSTMLYVGTVDSSREYLNMTSCNTFSTERWTLPE